MKRFIAGGLAFLLALTLAVPAFAEGDGAYVTTAKVAFVSDVADNGENLTNDYANNNGDTLMELPLTITRIGCELKITAEVGGEKTTVCGTPVARSENNHAIFFDASSDSANYKVVSMVYVNNADTGMYFKRFCEHSGASQILKVYLRNISSNTRDYVLLECFEYVFADAATIIGELPEDTVMGAWVASEFIPASVTYSDSFARMNTSNVERIYTVNYNYMGQKQTHTITMAADCTYGDIRVGQAVDIIHRLEIIGKTMRCPDDPVLNSDTASYLHVETATLRQTTVPNAAFISSSIDGKVLRKAISGPDLCASIAVSMGPLSIYSSIPIFFIHEDVIEINQLYEGYVNGRNNEYVRSISTSMQENFYLTRIGHFFEVRSTIGDFGNVTKSEAYHQAIWDLTLVNASDLSTQAKTIYQNVPISICN